MRARRLRPSFDALNQRIAPSDLVSVGVPVAASPTNTPEVCFTDIWIVAGTPQQPPSNVLQPSIDPTTWY